MDASKIGLAPACLQDGFLVAYTQRALAEAKNQCAQIKKELLAALFHDFIYGREAILKLTQTSHSNRKQASSNSPWPSSTKAVAAFKLQFEVHLQEKNRTAYDRHCHVPTRIMQNGGEDEYQFDILFSAISLTRMAELQRHNLMLVVYFFIWVARKARELTPRSKNHIFL